VNAIAEAWKALYSDQLYLEERFAGKFVGRSPLRAYLTNVSLRAAFWMRLSSASGLLGTLARARLLSRFSCDVSAGASIEGAIWLPHPIGIVVGGGVTLSHGVTLYQGVTLGAKRDGAYPSLLSGSTILPNAIVVGGIVVGPNSVVGAGLFCDRDIAAGTTLRKSTR
jgi:serine O-acetyltransferase